MRGENVVSCGVSCGAFGSPPHAWGKFLSILSATIAIRFTPTCVGKIILRRSFAMMNTVHPHMRGENPCLGYTLLLCHGSPPHAWGKCSIIADQICSYRFTPTCVGKMDGASNAHVIDPVHPHMRGENSTSRSKRSTPLGSPPHAWGKFPKGYRHFPAPRFTPTCVGKINIRAVAATEGTVHPHMRGENNWNTPS